MKNQALFSSKDKSKQVMVRTNPDACMHGHTDAQMHAHTPNKNCNNYVSLTRKWARQKLKCHLLQFLFGALRVKT